VHSLLGDQHAAGIVALAVTEATLLGVVVILLVRWSAAEDDAEQALFAGIS
jgi:cytochrome c oxidase assembly factor CtaG